MRRDRSLGSFSFARARATNHRPGRVAGESWLHAGIVLAAGLAVLTAVGCVGRGKVGGGNQSSRMTKQQADVIYDSIVKGDGAGPAELRLKRQCWEDGMKAREEWRHRYPDNPWRFAHYAYNDSLCTCLYSDYWFGGSGGGGIIMDVYSNRILVEFNTVGVRPMPGSISEEEFLRQLGRLMRNGGTLTADDSTLLGNPK